MQIIKIKCLLDDNIFSSQIDHKLIEKVKILENQLNSIDCEIRHFRSFLQNINIKNRKKYLTDFAIYLIKQHLLTADEIEIFLSNNYVRLSLIDDAIHRCKTYLYIAKKLDLINVRQNQIKDLAD